MPSNPNIAIKKKVFWTYLNRKLNYSIHNSHTYAIMSILFEEMFKDFKAWKEVRIHNFGSFQLQQRPDKRHHDFRTQTVIFSLGRPMMRFTLIKRLRAYLLGAVDIPSLIRIEANEKAAEQARKQKKKQAVKVE